MGKDLPLKFLKSSPFVFNIDFIDFATGAGVKNFYLIASRTSAAAEYAIATDTTLPGDSSVVRYGENATLEQDFDITFGNPATIAAADGSMSFSVNCEAAKTFDLTATVFHVTSGGTETPIGTGIALQTTGAVKERRSFKFTFTKKFFATGDKLRVTLDTISTGAATRTFLDPSGRETLTETVGGGTINSQFIFSVPFEVDV